MSRARSVRALAFAVLLSSSLAGSSVSRAEEGCRLRGFVPQNQISVAALAPTGEAGATATVFVSIRRVEGEVRVEAGADWATVKALRPVAFSGRVALGELWVQFAREIVLHDGLLVMREGGSTQRGRFAPGKMRISLDVFGLRDPIDADLPCDSLTLNTIPIPSQIPSRTVQWRTRGKILKLRKEPGAARAWTLRIDPKSGYGLSGTELERRGHWILVEFDQETFALRGWVPRSELTPASGVIGGGISCDLGIRIGPADSKTVKLHAGTRIYAAVDGPAWAVAAEDLDALVVARGGSPWLEVINLYGREDLSRGLQPCCNIAWLRSDEVVAAPAPSGTRHSN